MQSLSLYCFKNHRSGDVSPENPPVLFDVFEKLSKSVLDGLCTLQAILNFKLCLLKAVGDRQIDVLEWRQKFLLPCYNNGQHSSLLCNIIG